MKEFKGTPGTWIVIVDDEIKIIQQESLENGAGWRSYVAICEDVQCHADASLIAASPGLLSALQHLVEVYDSEDGKQWTTASKKAAIAEARAAIDKALGE